MDSADRSKNGGVTLPAILSEVSTTSIVDLPSVHDKILTLAAEKKHSGPAYASSIPESKGAAKPDSDNAVISNAKQIF
jgi:hypothetical protein